ncbi:MAG TPA: STAS domain-containing protein [Myxococcaceae bacterium]|jgi:rsbT co-antagonist protein RsbR
MTQKLYDILARHEADLLREWLREQMKSLRSDLIREEELKQQSTEFLRLFLEALRSGEEVDITATKWSEIRGFLEKVSASRTVQGFSPSQTATFVFSLKQPIFTRLRTEDRSADDLASDVWRVTLLLDSLGLFTTEVFQKSREATIARQHEEMLELSTPVVTLWEGVLALPLIGTLDSQRTQSVMEALLQRIVETESDIAIIDITGVPTVDTLTAQHLLKTITAARLMGADCIISGIRPQIAQTIVHLGVSLGDVVTKSSLAGAFQVALARRGDQIVRGAATRTPDTGR